MAKTGTGGKKADDERASDQPQTQTTTASPDFLRLLQQTHPQLLEVQALQLDQMFSQLQFNQLLTIPIFIQLIH